MNRINSILIIFFWFFLISCESRNWEEAKKQNSISSYDIYLKKHPNGSHTLQATDAIFYLILTTRTNQGLYTSDNEFYTKLALYAPEEIKHEVSLLAREWEKIEYVLENGIVYPRNTAEVTMVKETILRFLRLKYEGIKSNILDNFYYYPKFNIIVDQSYIDASNFSLDIEGYIESFLSISYNTPVIINDQSEEAITIHVRLKGIPKEVAYSFGGYDESMRFGSASIVGEIALKYKNVEIGYPLSYTYTNPRMSINYYPKPEEAPFKETLDFIFYPTLIKALAKLININALILNISNSTSYSVSIFVSYVNEICNSCFSNDFLLSSESLVLCNQLLDMYISAKPDERYKENTILYVLGELKNRVAIETLILKLPGQQKEDESGNIYIPYNEAVLNTLNKIDTRWQSSAEGKSLAEKLVLKYDNDFGFTMLNKEDFDAIYILGELKYYKAVKVLIKALNSNSTLSFFAHEALIKITGQNFPPEYNVWEQWYAKIN